MTLQCLLCPKNCTIEPGQSGECRIRVNRNDELIAVTYGYPCTVHVDPVEKKPLFHFLPGAPILSIATVGCNLHCKNCQNWEISQLNPEDSTAYAIDPGRVPRLAQENGCQLVAYTYTDPVAYYEYTLASCIRAREFGMRNVLVTAGYISQEPWKELCRHVDAITLDVKAFSDKFYREICEGTLQPVLDSLLIAKNLGVHVEVSNLVITTLNDSDKDFADVCRWIKENMGTDTPLHFLRFYPQYRMRNLPATPAETLNRARDIAMATGMRYVYIGNLLGGDVENTRCPSCRFEVITRQGHVVLANRLHDGACPSCGTKIYGVWK